MVTRLLLLVLGLSLVGGGCRNGGSIGGENVSASVVKPSAAEESHAAILAPLIDPTKLDALKGKRAGTSRLRKASYWLEIAIRDGANPQTVLERAHSLTGRHPVTRTEAQIASLIRNNTILERLGCLNPAGMDKLRRGKAPTITKGPYAGELATGDHIIPRSVCPELDNRLFNLEFMPETLNQRKGNKVTERQRDLAKKWHKDGLLSTEGLRQVMRARR